MMEAQQISPISILSVLFSVVNLVNIHDEAFLYMHGKTLDVLAADGELEAVLLLGEEDATSP